MKKLILTTILMGSLIIPGIVYGQEFYGWEENPYISYQRDQAKEEAGETWMEQHERKNNEFYERQKARALEERLLRLENP